MLLAYCAGAFIVPICWLSLRPQFSGPLPQLRVQRRGAFSAGLPPASGQRPSQQQPLGPSRPSLSAGQSHAAGLSLPSTMAVALGALSPPGGPGGLLGQVTPPTGGLGLQAGQPPGSAGMASLLPLAASMGVPASQLGSMAAALLQAQSSVLGAQQAQQPAGQGGATQQVQQQQQQQQLLPPPPLHKPAAQQAQQQQQQQKAAASQSMPPPAPLQALQQADALQSVVAMLQAQTSAIIGSGPALLPGGQQEGAQQQQQQQQQGPAQGGSGGAASAQSLPSLVGASAIQGHPLPPPFHAAAAVTPAPLQSFGGGTPAQAGGAAPATMHSGPFLAPGPLAAPAGTPMLHPTATAVSEIRGSPVQPATGVQQQQQAEVAAAQPAPAEQQADLAAPQQQAASAVQGSGNGAGSPRRPLVSPSPDPDQLAAEEERRRHEGDSPRPQAAVIVELPTADVAAASQGGGLPGGLPFAEPQEAAMLGGNSTFADAMELGAGG